MEHKTTPFNIQGKVRDATARYICLGFSDSESLCSKKITAVHFCSQLFYVPVRLYLYPMACRLNSSA
jgi:hypothetical protein